MSRILVYTDMGRIYGAEQCTHRICLALARAGHIVALAQPRADHLLVREREDLGIAHLWLEPDDLYELRRPARMLSDRTEPEQILDRARPDLVLFSDSSPLSGLAAKLAATDRNIPCLVVVHCASSAWAQDHAPHLSDLARAYRQVRQVVAVSGHTLEILRRDFHLPPDKGMVIPNGRPDPFFSPRSGDVRERMRRELGISTDAVVCLTVGRLDHVKGHQFLLAAIPLLRECPVWERLVFVWVGKGSLSGRLHCLLRLHRLEERILSIGERSDVADLLDAADIFVLPSLLEGMPLAVLEAMAKGLPVVTTAVNGIPEALGQTGWLLPDPRMDNEFPRRLSEAICSLAMDLEKRSALGRMANERALSLFREQPMLDAYLGLISSLLPGTPHAPEGGPS